MEIITLQDKLKHFKLMQNTIHGWCEFKDLKDKSNKLDCILHIKEFHFHQMRINIHLVL